MAFAIMPAQRVGVGGGRYLCPGAGEIMSKKMIELRSKLLRLKAPI